MSRLFGTLFITCARPRWGFHWSNSLTASTWSFWQAFKSGDTPSYIEKKNRGVKDSGGCGRELLPYVSADFRISPGLHQQPDDIVKAHLGRHPKRCGSIRPSNVGRFRYSSSDGTLTGRSGGGGQNQGYHFSVSVLGCQKQARCSILIWETKKKFEWFFILSFCWHWGSNLHKILEVVLYESAFFFQTNLVL